MLADNLQIQYKRIFDYKYKTEELIEDKLNEVNKQEFLCKFNEK